MFVNMETGVLGSTGNYNNSLHKATGDRCITSCIHMFIHVDVLRVCSVCITASQKNAKIYRLWHAHITSDRNVYFTGHCSFLLVLS